MKKIFFLLVFSYFLPSFANPSFAADNNVQADWLIKQGMNANQAGNNQLAFQCFQKAADQDNVKAELLVGECFENAIGVQKDYKKAFDWYHKVADKGNAEGEMKLGLLYAFGTGLSKNMKEAIQWFRKAAEQDDLDAEKILGNLYATGEGTAIDYKESFKWFTKAANQGDSYAESNLAIQYEKGLGTDKDLTQAIIFYKKAKAQGDESAIKALDRLGVVRSIVVDVTEDTFEDQVLKAKGPVLVDFYAVWCGPCHEYGPILRQIAEEYKGRLTVVRLDLDKCPKLTQKYKIKVIPTSFIFKNGKMLDTWTSLTTQEDVEKIIFDRLKLERIALKS